MNTKILVRLIPSYCSQSTNLRRTKVNTLTNIDNRKRSSSYRRILMQQRYVCNSSSRTRTTIWKTRHNCEQATTTPNAFKTTQAIVYGFFIFICNLEETFQTLGFTNDLNSTIYVQFAANKFHHSERLQWTQHIINNSIQQPSLINFSHWLIQFALACGYLPQENFTSLSIQPSSSSQQRNSEHQSNNHRGNQPQTRNYRFSENTKRLEKRRTPCAFCDMDHHPSQCLKYKDLTIDDKRKLIHAKKPFV